MLTTILCSCGDGTQKGRVGILLPSTETARWNLDGQYLWKDLSARGYAPVLAYANDNAEQQLTQLQEMVKDGCSYLVIAAVDSKVLLPDLAIAKAKGVRVIAYDRLLTDTEAVDCFISFDNYRIGRQMGLFLEEKLQLGTAPGPFYIELFGGDPADNNTALIYQGAMSVLGSYLDRKKLLVRSGEKALESIAIKNWSESGARERMNGLLKKFYSEGEILDAVLSMNDGMAMGIQASLTAHYPGRFPLITGQDCALPNIRSILAGKQAMSIFKDTRMLANKTVKVIELLEKGDHDFFRDLSTVPNRRRDVPVCFCPYLLVTAENCSNVLVKAGYYQPEQLQ